MSSPKKPLNTFMKLDLRQILTEMADADSSPYWTTRIDEQVYNISLLSNWMYDTVRDSYEGGRVSPKLFEAVKKYTDSLRNLKEAVAKETEGENK